MKVKFGFLLSTASAIAGGGYNPEKDFREAPIVMLKKVGDGVRKNDLIVEVSTDKVTTEVPLSGLCGVDSGTIVKLNFSESDTWRYGGIGEVSGEKMFMPELGEIETEDAAIEVPIGRMDDYKKLKEAAEAQDRVRAAPAARKLAQEHGIDINTINGTGPGGRVMRADVEAAIGAVTSELTPTKPESNDREALHATQIRKAIAYYMQKSHAEIPKAGDAMTVDVTNLWAFYRQRRETWREDTGTDFSFTGIFMYLATSLLYQQKDRFGIINAYWDKDEQDAYLFKHVNIGIAVQTPAGLMVPVIHSAETLSFREFMVAVHDKVQRVLAQKITLPELRDLTFTVNNVGAMGGENPDSIVPYTKENSGKERPTGMIMVLTAKWQGSNEKQYMKLAFSFDHRLFDGVPALEFVNALKRYIESKNNPEEFRELFNPDFTIK